MSRVVWDTAKKTGKDVKFEMLGEDTELDRSVIDRLANPLMHMVRNSVDHGVEKPQDRLENGKIKNGPIKLSAYHGGGSIYIKIQDDGKGLDPDKLLNKAREKGIITPEQNLSSLSDITLALQHYYIAANSNPLGEKHLLDMANDGTSYSKSHGKYHNSLRGF